MIHFIMLHDNISSTHEKYEWNTWTIFLLTWNILHVYLVFIMSHDLYHVTWHVSLTWSMSCDIILIIMSMQKNLLGIFKIMSTWFFQNPRRIIMSTWKIYHVQQRRIFLMWILEWIPPHGNPTQKIQVSLVFWCSIQFQRWEWFFPCSQLQSM